MDEEPTQKLANNFGKFYLKIFSAFSKLLKLNFKLKFNTHKTQEHMQNKINITGAHFDL